MTATDKITIESLFKTGETMLEFWDLRERASKLSISPGMLWDLLAAERKAGRIELLPNNNVRLLQKKGQWHTKITNGVKCPNKLCEAVRDKMEEWLVASTPDDTIEVWEKRLNDSIIHYSFFHPKCGLPVVTKWDNRQGKWFVNAYASETAYIRGGAFITISVTPL